MLVVEGDGEWVLFLLYGVFIWWLFIYYFGWVLEIYVSIKYGDEFR